MTQWAKYSSFRWLALVIREMIAASLWAFAFVKLWIYDVDIILIENFTTRHFSKAEIFHLTC